MSDGVGQLKQQQQILRRLQRLRRCLIDRAAKTPLKTNRRRVCRLSCSLGYRRVTSHHTLPPLRLHHTTPPPWGTCTTHTIQRSLGLTTVTVHWRVGVAGVRTSAPTPTSAPQPRTSPSQASVPGYKVAVRVTGFMFRVMVWVIRAKVRVKARSQQMN